MRGVRHLKIVAGCFLIGLTGSSLIGSAEAGQRWDWRFRRPHFQLLPDLLFFDDDENIYDQAYYEVEDEPIVRKSRRQKNRDLWWSEEDSDFEPIYEPPAPKKKLVSKPKVRSKVAAKKVAVKQKNGLPLTDLDAARAKYSSKGDIETASIDPAPKLKSKSKVLPIAKVKAAQAASLDKQDKPAGKTIGCTAGAAVVTGYGFGSVRPKTCTGETYAYDAARSGKNYLIKLSAASGEILDVKKLN